MNFHSQHQLLSPRATQFTGTLQIKRSQILHQAIQQPVMQVRRAPIFLAVKSNFFMHFLPHLLLQQDIEVQKLLPINATKIAYKNNVLFA